MVANTGSTPWVVATVRLTVVAAGMSLLAVFPACNHSADTSAAGTLSDQRPVLGSKVQLARAVHAPWPSIVRAQGTFHADEQVVVGAKIAGRVAETFVDLGSVVQAGESLAALEMELFELQLMQAQAELAEALAALGLGSDDPLDTLDPEQVPAVLLEQAVLEEGRRNLERMELLRGSNAVSQSEIDQQLSLVRAAEARYQAALNGVHEKAAMVQVRRSAVAVAQQNRRDAVVRAPFAGVIQQRHVAPGMYVQSGDPIATLVRTNPVRYRAAVPERKAYAVRVGQPIWIHLEQQEHPLRSEITRISPSLDLTNRSLVVEADVANRDQALRAGIFAEAEIVVDADATTLAVPASSVGEFAGVHKVWLVRGREVRQQVVEAGRRREDHVEIVAGISEGDLVVSDFREGRRGLLPVSEAEVSLAQPQVANEPSS